jgi:inositol-pentakisphosphate 2-kinase
MQNNFRVWYEGDVVFGEYENVPSTKYTEILQDLFGTHHCSHDFSEAKSILLDVIVHVVAKILHREKLLENLLCLQMLDVIDGDGAVLVYKRLVSHCGGSHSEAEMALEQNFMPPDVSLSSHGSSWSDSRTQDLFACSPYQQPEDSHLRELLNEIQHFRTHLRHQRQSVFAVDESIANTFHSSCVYHVKLLSKESCVYLLSNWLLSLTMCDVSFFVTFHFCEVGDNDHLNEEMLMERHQTEEDGGLLVSRLENIWGSPNTVIRYEVKAVDCDPKPAIKLRGREEVEQNFQFCF